MEHEESHQGEPFWHSEEAFRDAVAQATTAATEAATTTAIEKIERRRPIWMLIVAVLVGVVLGCGAAIPITIIIDKQQHSVETRNAENNCLLITKIAGALEQNFEETIQSRDVFLRQSKDRLGLTETQFRELLKRGDESQKKQIDAIKSVAQTDCAISG